MKLSMRIAFLSDIGAMLAGFGLAFVIRFSFTDSMSSPMPESALAAIATFLFWYISLSLNGAYRWSAVSNGLTDFDKVWRSSLVAFAGAATVSYVGKIEFSRIYMLLAFPIGTFFMILGRMYIRSYYRKRIAEGKLIRRVLLLKKQDTEPASIDLIEHLPQLGMSIVAKLRVNSLVEEYSAEWIKEMMRLIVGEKIDVVLVDQELHLHSELVADISWHLDEVDVEFLVVPEFLGNWVSRLHFNRHVSLPLIQLSEPRLNDSQAAAKRMFDLIVTVPLLIVTAIPMLLIAIVVSVSSRGPVFFTQDRVGIDGNLFPFHKFRTMFVGSEEARLATLGRPDSDMTERYKQDPRITPFGKFLRRFSLDELPQLWDVFIGKMSLVGPRPILTEEAAQLEYFQLRRQLAKPGLTGLWQINGRKNTTWDERMMLDLYYMNNWTAALDLAILTKTLRVVLSGEGSY